MGVLYLHIGIGKTGSSALQSFLAKNRERLYEDGIWYPELNASAKVEKKLKSFNGNAEFLNHFNVYFEDMSEKLRRLFEDTCKMLQNGDNNKDILLSREMALKEAEMVCKNFVTYGFDVKVIVYLRRQDLWGESSWNQNVKSRSYTESCFDFIQASEQQLDYYNRLKEIAAVVGKDNVIVSVYESGAEDIFTTFLSILGILNMENYQKDAYQANPSLSANYVEIKRILNSIPNGTVFMDSMKELLEEGKKYARTNEETVHAPSFLTREQRFEIIEKYHEGNTKLAREFLGRDVLFDESIDDCGEYGIDHETIYQDIIKFFGMIAVRQYKEIEKLKDALYKFEIPGECVGKRIVVYGIDILGSRLYKQLKAKEICKELVAVDRKFWVVGALHNIPVVEPETIRYEDIDYVMIAVENEKTYEAIKSYLIDVKKLKPEKILRMRLPET